MDKNKTKFDYRLQTPEPHIVALLGEIDAIKGEFKGGLRMTPQAITSLKRSVLVTSAGASTRIEGSKLTNEEVEKIMRGLTFSKFADRDSQEVQGYLETLQNIFDSYLSLPLREGMLLSLHNELLKYSDKDKLHKGKYKTGENTVGVLGPDGQVVKIMFEPTPAWKTPTEMTELIEWTQTALEENRFHPLLIVANFVVEFLKIHPFQDGNGRLSRILTNLLLLKTGYTFIQYVSHEQIVEHRKDEYYLALRKSQETFKTDHDTIAPWLNFFLLVIKEQATEALVYLKEENAEDTLSPKQYAVWKFISKKGDASPAEVVQGTGIIMATVRQALSRLVELKKIKRTGRGPGTRYIKITI
ncbi:MAG: Fic family protein [Candidatus Pacebacteria bacterium]|nr:Fic family protein [Candidatus Paceibacterota bacterium]MCF7863155.1 Fic family protein [Candidatus Paceibacterota bacterium]